MKGVTIAKSIATRRSGLTPANAWFRACSISQTKNMKATW
jgi:hypothetical protein